MDLRAFIENTSRREGSSGDILGLYMADEAVVLDAEPNGRKHASGTPCHAKKPENCPEFRRQKAELEGIDNEAGVQGQNAEKETNSASTTPSKMREVSPDEFAETIAAAKKACRKPEWAWRVDAKPADEYKDAKALLVTEGGSCAAVKADGDIVSLCKREGDPIRAKEILAEAVARGGDRFDSFEGNWDLYTKNGFEPVSWTPWNDDYAPAGWSIDAGNKREDVIFFRYSGKMKDLGLDKDSWKNSHLPFLGENGYAEAMKFRDDLMDNNNKTDKQGE